MLLSCSDSTLEKSEMRNISKSTTVWYRQAVVSLGAGISIESPNKGFAVSRGKGVSEKGAAYEFNDGKWIPTQQFDYSDFPQIIRYNSSTLWLLKHLVHKGNYRPVLTEIKNGISKDVELPIKMWDKNDFIMYRDIAINTDGTAFMVGQKGSILFYDKKSWSEFASPFDSLPGSNNFQNDLHSVYYNNGVGWIVGRGGLMLQLVGGKWKIVNSGTTEHLNCVEFVDKNNGFAIGEKGTVLKYTNGVWSQLNSGVRLSLKDIEVVGADEFYVVGARSLLLHYKNGNWTPNNDIKNYEDDFVGISTVLHNSERYFWVIGDLGIYTNYQNLGFSFTDVTSTVGLPTDFKAAVVGDVNNDFYPDIYFLNRNSPSRFYLNEGGKRFVQKLKPLSNKTSITWTQSAVFGDVDNDGNLDLFELSDDKNFMLLRGDGSGNFEDITDFSGIRLSEIDPTTPISARFINLLSDHGIDLYISNYNSMDNILFGNPIGEFSNSAFQNSKHASIPKEQGRESSGAVFSDFNNDGRTDILIPYRIQKNKSHFDLFYTKENKGYLEFEKSEQEAFYFEESTPIESVVASDINGDGFTDIIGYNRVRKTLLLLLNSEKGVFRKDTALFPSKMSIESTNPSNGVLCIVDINNDSKKDIFVGSHLLLNNDSIFVDVSIQSGMFAEGTYSYLDYDNDGDFDILVGTSDGLQGVRAKSFLYRNNLNPNPVNKLTLRYGFYDDFIGTSIVQKIGGKQETAVSKNILYEIGLGNNSQSSNQMNNLILPSHPQLGSSLYLEKGKTANEFFAGEYSGKRFIINSDGEWHPVKSLYVVFIRFLYLFSPVAEALKILFLIFILIIFYLYLKRKWNAQKKLFNTTVLSIYFLIYAVLTFFLYDIQSFLQHTLPPILLLGTFFLQGSIVVNDVKKRRRNLIGKYEIIKIVGEGAMGVVHKAIDTSNGNVVALKVLKKELFEDPENRKRFTNEGRILTSLNNPHIVKVFEASESREYSFFAMQFVEGKNIAEIIKESGKFSIQEVIKAGMQIAAALSEIHSKGILHRDIKSHNIMTSESGYVLMDFGLSRSSLLGSQTSTGAVIGTLGYSAPEQITNSSLDERTDIFGLGVVLYEMVTGTMPFKGNNEMALLHSLFNLDPVEPGKINELVPKALSDVILNCLQKNPQNRYQSSEELVSSLERIKNYDEQ